MGRCYYFQNIKNFIEENNISVFGALSSKHEFALDEQQKNSWITEITLLKTWVKNSDGSIILEYSIPRMGRRVDCVILSRGIIFVIEFKIGASTYDSNAIDQVTDYALDLKNFHEQSHTRKIIPILVCNKALEKPISIQFSHDGIAEPILTNGKSLELIINKASALSFEEEIDGSAWITSIYKPTPTIIEAAQALYNGHDVSEISQADSGAINLSKTTQAITTIIKDSRKYNQKSICFITGVPGAGKTLAGLNLASSWYTDHESEHAIFLSGNGPLVEVLREALARNEVLSSEENGNKTKKSTEISKVKAFIQNIHQFRDDVFESNKAPIEKIVIFDEAQRAWTLEQTATFMKTKKGISDFHQSEPEFLISVMNRHSGWATIICLIGGGQEINTGEAGLHEWFDALKKSFPDWKIYLSDRLDDFEYTRGKQLYGQSDMNRICFNKNLHLAVSVRSFRSEKVSSFVKALLDCDTNKAKDLISEIKSTYPIYLTRDLNLAKGWLRSQARGSERYGIVASSGAMRLKPFGLNVKSEINPVFWFLNGKSDVRSSYFLEDVATEFDIQGLELDWICVSWDADFRHNGNDWSYKLFRGTRWQDVNQSDAQIYLKNAYRVLLTRARQGMIIFLPYGSLLDETRQPDFYDKTFDYLASLGIDQII